MITRPPDALVAHVERAAPGIYRWFFDRLNNAHRGIRIPTITSYYRTPSKGASVGGSSYSQHLVGLGIDFVYPTKGERAAALAAMKRAGLIAIDEGDHVHVQALPASKSIPLLKWLGF